MKITRRQLRKLISESINEMNYMKRKRNMEAGQRTYDAQEDPGYAMPARVIRIQMIKLLII